ncbi:hypothetical protein C8K36_1253 [Rhodococcus sp. OK519]|uniref:hypothetical protein n=1 Tax=Rhodococcus sp. OK519 TaxID=2135729 RepID=UPI000D447355|nr:hypothetical protein C8K36_1253 [Rhodococcus sp. OK519]
MNSKHGVNGVLFSNPRASVGPENNEPARAVAGSTTALLTPQRKTSEEIHRALFSAQ